LSEKEWFWDSKNIFCGFVGRVKKQDVLDRNLGLWQTEKISYVILSYVILSYVILPSRLSLPLGIGNRRLKASGRVVSHIVLRVYHDSAQRFGLVVKPVPAHGKRLKGLERLKRLKRLRDLSFDCFGDCFGRFEILGQRAASPVENFTHFFYSSLTLFILDFIHLSPREENIPRTQRKINFFFCLLLDKKAQLTRLQKKMSTLAPGERYLPNFMSAWRPLEPRIQTALDFYPRLSFAAANVQYDALFEGVQRFKYAYLAQRPGSYTNIFNDRFPGFPV
jgi:hypothetical protein